MSENLNKQENVTTCEETTSLSRLKSEESAMIPQLESTAQFSLSVLEVSNSVSLLNSSTEQMKTLMLITGKSSDSLDKQVSVRCARELREAIKTKIDLARFVLRTGVTKVEGAKH